MNTKPQYDWADDMALDVMADAERHAIPRARELIAMRLRKLRIEGEYAGIEEALKKMRGKAA